MSEARPGKTEEAMEGAGAAWGLRPTRTGLGRMVGMGSGAMLAGFCIGTALEARFGEVWCGLYFLALAAGWSLTDMSLRYYLRFGRTPMSIFRGIHPYVGLGVMGLAGACAIIGSAGQWNTCAMVLTSFKESVPLEVSGGVAAFLAAMLLFQGSFERLEKVIAAGLVLTVLCFIGSAALSGATWADVWKGLGRSGSWGGGDGTGWVKAIGASSSAMVIAWLALLYPYAIAEKGWYSERTQEKVNLLGRARFDNAWAMIAAAAAMTAITAAGAAVVGKLEVLPASYNEYVGLLDPIAKAAVGKAAGKFAAKLFLAGRFIAAWTTGIAWWLGGMYAILEMFHLPIKMNSRPARTVIILFLAPSAAILFAHVDAGVQTAALAILAGILFAVVGVLMVWRVSRKDMGYFRWSTRAAWLVALDLIALAVCLVAAWGKLSSIVGG